MQRNHRGSLAPVSLGLAAAVGIGLFLMQPAHGAGTSQADAQMIYGHKCAVCHAADGSGNTMKGRKYKVKPVQETVKKDKEPQMIQIVEKGKGANMDSFSDELTPAQIKAVVEYYRALCKCLTAKNGKH